ncbi:Hypothetical predicted protein [Podarcis lilfordi]|uniref:Uncharacterized protein n=1 Tax=Podarcis lilfordi TaxID=74358 RepID=A0AA35QQ84_9SAUR|nr:Hypothetical predicted protein [Podarcis lilfordi]
MGSVKTVSSRRGEGGDPLEIPGGGSLGTWGSAGHQKRPPTRGESYLGAPERSGVRSAVLRTDCYFHGVKPHSHCQRALAFSCGQLDLKQVPVSRNGKLDQEIVLIW